MPENNEILALIDLLDDPDKLIYEKVKSKILSYGTTAIPVLEQAWEESENLTLQERIENIIHYIQFDRTYNELTKWADTGTPLLNGYLIISKYQFPELIESEITETLTTIVRDIWLEINEDLTALEKVKVLNHIFFDIHGFKSVTEEETHTRNQCINTVLHSKKGNNLALSILYSIIAGHLNIPIIGVNLPQHFILAYLNDSQSALPILGDEILFYINVMNKGSILSRREIDLYLKDMQLEPQNSYYTPCSNKTIIRLIIEQLIIEYDKLQKSDKVNELTRLKELLNEE